jgi:hypothetical protein
MAGLLSIVPNGAAQTSSIKCGFPPSFFPLPLPFALLAVDSSAGSGLET